MNSQLRALPTLTLILGTGASVQGGGLNTLEQQTDFWEDVTATTYIHGACGFFLEPPTVLGADSVIFASIAAEDGSAPQVWPVGTFVLLSQSPIEPADKPAVTVAIEESAGGPQVVADSVVREMLVGHASFDTGLQVDLTAVSVEAAILTVGLFEFSAIDSAFVPIETHEPRVGAFGPEAGPLQPTGVALGRSQYDKLPDMIGPLDEGSDCPWVWCHRPDDFCDDVAVCEGNRDAEVRRAIRIRTGCLAATGAGYSICMEEAGCWVNGSIAPGPLCAVADIACSAAEGLAEAVCKSTYLGLATAAEWNFKACVLNAQATHGKSVPGCNCPDGWEPFPTQTPPSWSHVECADGLFWLFDGKVDTNG